MNEITKETRRESFLKRPQSERKRMILRVLSGKEMTARQIANELGFIEMNMVRPRITELKNEGLIEAVDKVYDNATKSTVAIFAIKEGFDVGRQ